MLPVREIIQRHGVAVKLQDLPEPFCGLWGEDLPGSDAVHEVRHKGHGGAESGAVFVVEQDKPSGVENFICPYIQYRSSNELIVCCYNDPEKSLGPMVLALDPGTIRLLGIGLSPIKRMRVKRVMDE